MGSKHRVLVVGVGSIGERHTRCLLATGRARVGVCEPNTNLRKRIRDRYDIDKDYDDLDEALRDPWDSVLIASPAHTHLVLAKKAIQRGLATLIEKPLDVTVQGAAELSRLIPQRGVSVGVAYVYRAHPSVRAMRDAIASGRFGKPIQVSVVAGQHFPFYRPVYAETYYASHANGGGAIQDALTHLVNAVEWMVGPLTRLAALADHRVLPNVTVEDTVNVLARHDDVTASYTLNQHQAPNETMLQVVCSNGTCRFDAGAQEWAWITEPTGQWQREPVNLKSRDDWFILQEHAWLDVLDGKTGPLCSFEEGLHTLRVNCAALESAKQQGTWIDIAPCNSPIDPHDSRTNVSPSIPFA